MARPSSRNSASIVSQALVPSASGQFEGKIYTSYRNPPLDHTMRAHWAILDAGEPRGYNEKKCEMVAQMRNTKLSPLDAAGGPFIGFWCVKRLYDSKGAVRGSFLEAFPVG
jgi:hypothetical protein